MCPVLIAQIKSHDPPPRTVNHVRSNYSIIYTDPSPCGWLFPANNQCESVFPPRFFAWTDRGPWRNPWACHRALASGRILFAPVAAPHLLLGGGLQLQDQSRRPCVEVNAEWPV